MNSLPEEFLYRYRLCKTRKTTSKILRLASLPIFSLALRVKCTKAESFKKIEEYHNVTCTFFTTSQRASLKHQGNFFIFA